MTSLWPAPLADGPVDGVVDVPGSKSATNRALVLAALASGPSTIRGGLRARDSDLMLAGLQALGVAVDDGDGHWRITPGHLRGPAAINCGLAGTVMRFLPPVAALADGPVTFDGDVRARQRPMAAMLAALRALGARIDPADALPFTVHGEGRLRGGPVTLDASGSSQFVSGLLLAAARFDEGLTLRHSGPPVPSLPHIAMTAAMLAEHGVVVTADTGDPTSARWHVPPSPLLPRDRTVEPDLSNALPFLAAALATSGRVRIPRWPTASSQPGAVIPDLLTRMGATCTLDGEGLTVAGGGRIRPLTADLGPVGELTPVLAALCVLADGSSHLSGIAHLRGHETDRLAALRHELGALGADVTETADGLDIAPRPLHGAIFHTYEDHRLATAAAVLGLVVPGVAVEDVGTTAKTLPGFAAMWQSLVAPGQGNAAQ